METVSFDLAVLGGGGAGLRAAIAAAESANGGPPLSIGIVSKVYPMRSHTVSAEGGAAGVMRDDDSFDLHAYDTIKGSDFLADQEAVEAFVREAPGELIRLEHWGCPWSREPDGRIAVRAFGGMSTKRTCFAADKTGFFMLHALFQTSLKYESIRRLDEHFATALLVEDGRCLGLTCIDIRTGEMKTVLAKAVIIATGGAGRIFAFTTNAFIKSGDGMALAYRAGVPLKDMEFVQYHPTGLPGTGILITEASRGEGGHLVNKDGERFLKRYVPTKMELGPRDMLSRAIIQEFEAGRGFEGPYGEYVHLDIRHLGEKLIDKKIPFVRELVSRYVGIDPVHEPIPVRPVVHYMMGGVDTDKEGATRLPGLFAAGECACVSMNGANRLGSNSLTELLVFGARAGRSAARAAREAKAPTANPVAALAERERERVERDVRGRTGGKERVGTLRAELQKVMERGAGVYRTEERMAGCVAELAKLKERYLELALDDRDRTFNTDLTGALELGYMLDVAEAVAHSARARQESRGSHTRRDFPDRDDARFLKHTLAYRAADGAGPPRLDYSPVSITKWKPEERKY